MRARDVTAWRRRVLASKLPSGAKVVGMVLHEHMDWDGPDAGGNCWPSLSTIEAESGMTRRSVIRSVTNLLDGGWIERRCRRGCESCRGGNGHLMDYTAHHPQQCHSDTAQQGHRDTAHADSAVSSVQPAVTFLQSAGSSGHRQQGHGDTRPSLDLPLDHSKDLRLNDGKDQPQGSCSRCSNLGQIKVRDYDSNGRPVESLSRCPECNRGAA